MKKLFSCALLFSSILALPVLGADRPNFVFLFTDDQTTYSLGCYGNEDVKTPH
ncbi:MAG: arylsulfatase, partial [Verrucomicrobiota bacterium]